MTVPKSVSLVSKVDLDTRKMANAPIPTVDCYVRNAFLVFLFVICQIHLRHFSAEYKRGGVRHPTNIFLPRKGGESSHSGDTIADQKKRMQATDNEPRII